jgi:hypothetical protein
MIPLGYIAKRIPKQRAGIRLDPLLLGHDRWVGETVVWVDECIRRVPRRATTFWVTIFWRA